jgi:hypothetical protein
VQIWTIAVVVSVSGAVGGFVNALLAGDLHLPHREHETLYSPGWIGNVVIGAVAALVVWGLYGPMAKVAVISSGNVSTPVALTIAEVAGSILTGIGGGRILSSEVEKKALTKMKDELTGALRDQHAK